MARKRLKKEAADGAARTRLLSVAMELFYRKGYAATTVREIVKKAGVTPPVMYYYFGNKEGIFRELIESELSKAEAVYVGLPHETGSVKEKMLRLVADFFSVVVENTDAVKLMLSMNYGPPQQGTPAFDFGLYHQRFYGAIRDLVEEAIETGEVLTENPEDLTWVIYSIINTAMEIELFRPGKGLGPEGVKRILSLMLDQRSPNRRGR